MSSINSVRIPGLATGMDTDQMIKDMLTVEQKKIDKVMQNQQIVKWKQETYRDITKNTKEFYDKYFRATSKDYILGSKSFNTLNISSSNDNVITASGTSSANSINYKFEVSQMATGTSMSSGTASNGTVIKKDSKLKELGVTAEISFKLNAGTGSDSKVIIINQDDTVTDLVNKINDSFSGEIKAYFSDMTGKLTIQSTTTGKDSVIKVVDVEKNADGKFIDKGTSDALSFLNMTTTDGKNASITVKDSSGNIIKELSESKNNFDIDGIIYNVKNIGEATLTSTQDCSHVVDNIEGFVNDYNKIIEKIYDLVIEKKTNGYPPLTEDKKKEMTEDEIKNWEKKSKEGMLRNDSELRSFMDDMKKALFSPLVGSGKTLADIGITSADNYNKQGQLGINKEKLTKALKENGNLVERVAVGVFGKAKETIYKYVGTSRSVFAKKAGIENTSSTVNNHYSQQIKKQEDQIKILTKKMKTKEQLLYSKFARLESTMNKLNSQMKYFMNQ